MSTYRQDKGKSIDGAFNEYHAKNPKVYSYFKHFVNQAIANGKTKTSSKLIVNRIRWEVIMDTSEEDFKINDAFTSRYSRLFIHEHPEHEKIFKFRHLRR